MDVLCNRELRAEDIPLIQTYWRSLTPDDIRRMHINVEKLLPGDDLRERLLKVIDTPPAERQGDPLIWEVNGKTVGLTNLNNIERGREASVHLHMFDVRNRGKGFGRQLFLLSVQKYLKRHQLTRVICEPASGNPGPNGLMRALGIPIARTYVTKTPSVICFEHEVNRYEIDQALAGELDERLRR